MVREIVDKKDKTTEHCPAGTEQVAHLPLFPSFFEFFVPKRLIFSYDFVGKDECRLAALSNLTLNSYQTAKLDPAKNDKLISKSVIKCQTGLTPWKRVAMVTWTLYTDIGINIGEAISLPPVVQ